MNTTKHNPDYKLAGTIIFTGSNFIELVYGETNEGQNIGLEAYFKKEKNGHFYTSRRWDEDSIPTKYTTLFSRLQHECWENCPAGHKLEVELY